MTREIHRPMISSSSRLVLGRERRLVVQNHKVHGQVVNMRRLIAFSLILAYFKESAFVHTYIHVAKGSVYEASWMGKKTEVWIGVAEGKDGKMGSK